MGDYHYVHPAKKAKLRLSRRAAFGTHRLPHMGWLSSALALSSGGRHGAMTMSGASPAKLCPALPEVLAGAPVLTLAMG